MPSPQQQQQQQQEEEEREQRAGGEAAPPAAQPPPLPAVAAGPTLMAVAGAEPSQIDVWDLRSGLPCAVLQQTQEPSHGMCMALALLGAPGEAAAAGSAAAAEASAAAAEASAAAAEASAAAAEASAAAAEGPRPQRGGLAAALDRGAGSPSGSSPSTSPGASASPGPSASASTGLHVLAGYEDGAMAMWDLRRPSTPVAEARLHAEPIMCLAIHPQRTMGLSGSAESHVAMFALDVAAGQLRELKRLPLPAAGCGAACFRPDGRICASGGWDGKVRLFHSRRLEPLALLRVSGGRRGRVLGAGRCTGVQGYAGVCAGVCCRCTAAGWAAGCSWQGCLVRRQRSISSSSTSSSSSAPVERHHCQP